MLRPILLAAASLAALSAAPLRAQSTHADARRAELLRQRDAIDAELRSLDRQVATAATPAPAKAPVVPPSDGDVVVTGRALTLTTRVMGQTDTTITDADVRNTPATTIADIVKLSPGVTIIGGNGPRDVGVSIRGSNARNSFGARNIQVFEDDFPVTQPDGLARFDLTDPHAYGAVDVVRGPSSARYGNYAIGGAINFRTRRGRDIDGAEIGLDGGSDGYVNGYATIGRAGPHYEYALFGSFVRANGATGHTDYQTGTINAYGTYALGDRDRVAAKVIYNEGDFRLSTRLSYNQYLANPYQRGCQMYSEAARVAGCGFITVFRNGTNAPPKTNASDPDPTVRQTAAEGDLARNDRRTIVGTRYEHDFSDSTTWRTQATFDSRVVNQPTSANPFKGTLDSYNITSDVTDHGRLLGMEATSFVGLFYNYLDNQSYTFNKTPDGRNGFGALSQTIFGDVRNFGARAREELGLTDALRLVVGIGAERSLLKVRQTAYTYPVGGNPVLTLIPAEDRFWNVAPEASLVWRAADALKLHARFGTAYGIPQAGQLFVTAAGVPGNNISLRTQKSTGVDVGAELALGETLTAEVTGFYEWFRNEQVTTSAGVNLLAFTTNAPRSEHRGIELGLKWRPVPAMLPGAYLQADYSYNDQRYTDFTERLTSGAVSAAFDRAGNRIPGVIPHFADIRADYDQKRGSLAGMGGFVEIGLRSHYFIDNGNQLAIPGYTLVNLNLHYDPPKGNGWWSRLSFFASMQNLTDRTYVGSASIIADSLTTAGQQSPGPVLTATTGSIYAGQPRTVVAGVKTRF